MKQTIFNKVFKNGKERDKLPAGSYYAIANGKFSGDPKTKKDDIELVKGKYLKLTEAQATGLCKSIMPAKEADELLKNSKQGMTTKAVTRDS